MSLSLKSFSIFVWFRKSGAGGLEPPRSCERQPLKLIEIACWHELTRSCRRILHGSVRKRKASDDFIRTNFAHRVAVATARFEE